MRDDPLHEMILDALERGRRNEPIPCDACGMPTPPKQLHEAAVPDRRVDFGGYDIVLRRVRQFCPTCRSHAHHAQSEDGHARRHTEGSDDD